MPFITQGKANLKYILIIVILAVIVGGGILAYQFWWLPKEEIKPLEEMPEEVITPPGLNLQTTKLASAPEGFEVKPWSTAFSPDGRQVAYLAEKNGKFFIFLNEKMIGEYEAVEGGSVFAFKPRFSPDGKHLAYLVEEGQPVHMFGKREGVKEFIVIDDKEGKKYDNVSELAEFSPDSKYITYKARIEEKVFVVLEEIGGEIQEFEAGKFKKYYALLSPSFTPDGQKIVYDLLKEDGTESIIIRDLKGNIEKEYEEDVINIIFSSDDKKMALIKKQDRKTFVTVGDKKSKLYDEVKMVQFLPDNKQVIYIAREGATYTLIIGEKESKPYDEISNFIFTPDGKQIAYEARRGEKWFVVKDEKEDEGHDGSISVRKFCPDGKLVYLETFWIEALPVEEFLFVGERKFRIKPLEVESFIVSPDCKKIVYLVALEPRALTIKGMHVVIGDKKGKVYDEIYSLAFSPDGNYITYGAMDGNELWWIVEPVE